jgi:peptidoglycan/xylan/chitin deacetylase (PgdA/CDA1 family)
MPDLFLTFDVEDFIKEKSFLILKQILDILDDAELKGLFFITGHVADKLKSYPELKQRLGNHEIGYHSTSHSVRPLIIEYTDLEDYYESVEISLKRETSRISPTTGEILGSGGLLSLKELFPKKSIVSFRAPGFAWSPPMLEALTKLGIKCDFSTSLKAGPLFYKGIQFFPFPIVLCPPDGYPFNLRTLARSIRMTLSNGTTVLLLHPASLTNQEHWDSIYFQGNPKELVSAKDRNQREERQEIKGFSIFIERISSLKKAGLIEVTPPFRNASKRLEPTRKLVDQIYLDGVQWGIENFNCKPSFLYSHYLHFFGINDSHERVGIMTLDRLKK